MAESRHRGCYHDRAPRGQLHIANTQFACPQRQTSFSGHFPDHPGRNEGGEPNDDHAAAWSWGEAGTPAGHLTARTRQLTSQARVRKESPMHYSPSTLPCEDLGQAASPRSRHRRAGAATVAGWHRRQRIGPGLRASGTASPPVRAAATGTSTPATASTVACSSQPAPGAASAAGLRLARRPRQQGAADRHRPAGAHRPGPRRLAGVLSVRAGLTPGQRRRVPGPVPQRPPRARSSTTPPTAAGSPSTASWARTPPAPCSAGSARTPTAPSARRPRAPSAQGRRARRRQVGRGTVRALQAGSVPATTVPVTSDAHTVRALQAYLNRH